MRTLLCTFALTLIAADRPNVLVIISDDQRFDALGCAGNSVLKTPHLDALARRGFTFTHAFCMGSTVDAVCCPSRAMLMTGRTLFHAPLEIPAAMPTWPAAMRAAGYETFGTGKWHNGPAAFARGFGNAGNVFFGSMAEHWNVPVQDFDPTGRYSPARARYGDGFSTELFTDAALQFLNKRKGDKPFFMYVALTAPHDPRTPPKRYAALYDPAKVSLPADFMAKHPFDNGDMMVRDEMLYPPPHAPEVIAKHIADYYGMITHMDAQIGRIFKALDDAKQTDNTIVIFTSDHGLCIGSHGLMGKQNLYDCSMRPPLLIAGPGVPAGKKSDALCYLFDLFPTVCDMTGVPIPETVEGKSLLPIIKGEQTKVRDSVFGAYREVQRMVRTERWKLIRYPRINKSQLFDLKADPDELRDLSADPAQAERVKEMAGLLADWQKQLNDPLTAPNRKAP
jgi:arylsulfatase A-like enzyme